MSLENLYNQGKESFVPDISDNPECVWFYAAWKRLFGWEETCSQIKQIKSTIQKITTEERK